ncbi:MAG: hypothetical protein DSM106950_44360 [Stigonema ocellatum SAG 48.90 = DSM 106950]|nr:hypothetical protein [Stigonema ocellatum SAG 48.90 = DSM 106950]
MTVVSQLPKVLFQRTYATRAWDFKSQADVGAVQDVNWVTHCLKRQSPTEGNQECSAGSPTYDSP